MSADCRATLARLRRQYANAFQLALDDVVTEEWPDDDGCVYAPKYPTVPRWTVKTGGTHERGEGLARALHAGPRRRRGHREH